MKLQVPFVQLPLRYDAAHLLEEVERLGEEVWRPHPQGYAGNSALPLIAVDGDPSSDSISGPMRPTPHLDACPYLRQVLASMGAVWGRSRLMRLSGHAEVPAHSDLAYYWRERVRVHVPILTQPTVRFICGEGEVNMAAGECWIFDTWRTHRVINAAQSQRIHLVADTVGGERFWELASGGRVAGRAAPGWHAPTIAPDPGANPELIYESVNLPSVMSPWELRDHLNFLIAESQPHPQLSLVQQESARLCATWLGLWAQSGSDRDGWPAYRAALDRFAHAMKQQGQAIVLRNGSPFLTALAPMILRSALDDRTKADSSVAPGTDPDAGARADAPSSSVALRSAVAERTQSASIADPRFDRPVFIVSPPRSGSTLLFETLARAPALYTVGGESHGRLEGMPELHPAARGFESNRLGVDEATPAVIAELRSRFDEVLRDRDGSSAPPGHRLRMLEKTPKNALRIPFLRKVFPDARFIYLYREPREVLSSMIEAWSSGRFRTYPNLPDWGQPAWSLALVPGWRELRGKPLPEIVARQWEATTRILLDDLAEVPADRVHRVRYDAFLAAPQSVIQGLCSELGLDWDTLLKAALPHSVHTLSAPSAGKWRRHEHEIEAILPLIAGTAERAEAASRTG
ncbi:sulfotransferase [Dokdonella immobilis]|uniref:Aspartyl/Asparaginyl beta-hydroxylase n=1 Tax=Dokdonella immobilis TaxID=578942 RepID=A0A1I4WBR3_9GAMM|nr:sulfotransferase [Dokdonella immobilis]SFN10680.1 Aspartyl/Asparaginyl beta-hydroxylase [Dokdonella immobilis]